MKLSLLFATILASLLSQSVSAQVQCAIDIQIQEGSTIEFCANNPLTISGAPGYLNYNWSGAEVTSGQTITPNFSGLYILSSLDGDGCVSRDTIVVTINPNPTDAVISSEGNPICPGVGTTLSLSNPYATYDWGGGITSPTLFVTTAGTYSVTFTDGNGCDGTASIVLTEYDFQMSNTSNSFCSGGTVTLTASGGATYVWSTGEIGNTIVVSPDDPTVYSVVISQGTCSQTLSTTVTPTEVEGFELPDTMYVASGSSVFIPGPTGFASYNWSPGNQINNQFTAGVTFTGTESQMITVTATHSEGCILVDSVMMIIVSLTIPNGLSPNNDSRNDAFHIPELEDYPAKVSIWNRWGDLVLEDPAYKNDWYGTCETTLCLGGGELPEGTYFYLVDVKGITFSGYLTLKR